MLQDYYQQALLSDGLQRIDEWTFIIQDWDETLGILEVGLFFLTRHKLSVIMFSQPGFIMCGLCQQARLVSRLCAIALTDVIGVASISASSRSMPIIFSSSDPFHWLPTHPLFLLPIPQPSVPSFFRSVVHVVLAFKVESGPLSRCPGMDDGAVGLVQAGGNVTMWSLQLTTHCVLASQTTRGHLVLTLPPKLPTSNQKNHLPYPSSNLQSHTFQYLPLVGVVCPPMYWTILLHHNMFLCHHSSPLTLSHVVVAGL